MSVDYFTCDGCREARSEYERAGECEKCCKIYCTNCKDNLNEKDYDEDDESYSKCKLCKKEWKLVKISE